MTSKKSKFPNHHRESGEKSENKWEAKQAEFMSEGDSDAVPDSGQSNVCEENEVQHKQQDEEALSVLTFPEREALEEQLTLKEQELAKYKDKIVRLSADFKNQDQIHQRKMLDAVKFGKQNIISDLLPVLDSLERSLTGEGSEDSHVKSMREGIRLTLDLFEKALARHGVVVIAPKKGEVFDPEWHEAVSTIPDKQFASNVIIKLVQKGCQLNGRVLRAAMVVVAR